MKTPDAKTDWEDVAVLPPARDLELTLDDVSLENVQMQVLWQGRPVPARGHAGVSLIDKKSRGIHMSRLFRILTALGGTELNWSHLNEAVDGILTSHQGLSDSAYVEVAFEATVARPSFALAGRSRPRGTPLPPDGAGALLEHLPVFGFAQPPGPAGQLRRRVQLPRAR
jgi:GTP cyclohydrolase FolE2